MIHKKFEDINYFDLEILLNNQVAENKTLEYKREISSNEKLLAGVSALANSSGGDFIIGIEAKDGIPINLKGIIIKNPDDEILRLEQILQNGLEPRLPSTKNIKHIQSPNGEHFFLIRVTQSWIAPHRVKCKDKDYNDKFYGRHSGGKYPMDVSELKTAFMLTEQISERIKLFRKERVAKIIDNDELPVELATGGKMILHLIPLSAFTTSFEFDLHEFYSSSFNLLPLGTGASNIFTNLDGVISYVRDSENKAFAYAQFFRSGCIESVRVFDYKDNQKKNLPSTWCEDILIKAVTDYRKLLSNIGVELPVTVFVTFIGVKEYNFVVSSDYSGFEKRMLDRDNLFFSEQIIYNQVDETSKILRPIFDRLWNAYGFSHSFNFDKNGERKTH